ncbi:carbohydrate ABC transporter permease [Humibacter ginsenosidimutans]|uniref:Carbohydrate ABC transporter permease n=1 Tax=Humibacter ginsenosidimutans TaxID=2599293 RepID=A0A5B8M763_9MICO|nr:carbohydrate ABC transporter permease [Humibacter ginsenosidimutans]QDZ15834.1 carbohydrate ABC transporter permease [Humibacter ginsenosidimutans]
MSTVPRIGRPSLSAALSTFVAFALKASLWLWVVFNLAMLVWIFLNSVKSSRDIFAHPLGLPTTWHWDNFWTALTTSGLGVAALNTVVLVAVSVAVIMALSVPAAYALARLGGRSAGPITSLFSAGMSVPFQAFAVPMVLISVGLSRFMVEWITGAWDPRITVAIFYVALSLPFSVFVLVGYFRSLPSELEEAGALDGAGSFRTFLSIMVPLAKSGITTVTVLNVLGLWNETMIVLLLVPNQGMQTLNVALLNFYSDMQYTSDWGGLFAGIVIVVAPMVILYFWVGRRVVSGMTEGIGK